MTQAASSELWPKTKKFTLKNVNLWRWEFSALPLFWRDFLQSEDLFSGSSKKLFFLRFHSPTLWVCWLALSNANCSFLPTQRSYCFALILQERSPKLFLWIYFIKKMLLALVALCVIFMILVSPENVKKMCLGGCTIISTFFVKKFSLRVHFGHPPQKTLISSKMRPKLWKSHIVVPDRVLPRLITLPFP